MKPRCCWTMPKTVAALPALRDLNLDYTEVSDEGLALLSSEQPLERLSLDSAHISDESLETLSRLPHLKALDLYHTLVTTGAKEKLDVALPECKITFDPDSSRPNRRRS